MKKTTNKQRKALERANVKYICKNDNERTVSNQAVYDEKDPPELQIVEVPRKVRYKKNVERLKVVPIPVQRASAGTKKITQNENEEDVILGT